MIHADTNSYISDNSHTANVPLKERYFDLWLTNSQSAIMLLDASGRVEFYNEQMRLKTGDHSRQDTEKPHFSEVFRLFGNEEFIENAKNVFQEIQHSRKAYKLELIFDFSGRGNPRNYIVQTSPFFDKRGAFSGAIVSIIDAEDLLSSESEENTRLLLNSAPLACVLLDNLGNPIDCNDRALSIFGVSDKNALLEHFYDYAPKHQHDGSLSIEKARQLHHQAYSSGEIVSLWDALTADRQELPLEISMQRMHWRNDWRVVACMRDLRAIREANERNAALEMKNRTIQAATEAKSRFLASMSHEIRTPMNAIVGLAELMRIDNLDPRQKQYLQDIRGMSRVLLQILNDILDFSKIESGKMELRPTHYSIRRLFDNVCDLTRISLGGKMLDFKTHIADDVPEVIFGDETRLQQILFNILNNAVKYTDEGNIEFQITRGTRKNRECLIINVKDTGIGIKTEDIPHLFERFTQFDFRKGHGSSGTGLGLAITKQLVEMMDGVIYVASDFGKGSKFTVWLPLIRGDRDKMEKNDVNAANVTIHPEARILVVDDNPVNLIVALGHLERLGCKADSATSGEAAIAAIGKKSYDLVFMDHMMPGIDGIEATRRIRIMDDGRFRNLPIIALSANALSGMRENFIAAGMSDFVPKPIHTEDMARVVCDWMPPEKLIIAAAPPRFAAPSQTMARKEIKPAPSQNDFVLNQEQGIAFLQGDYGLYRKILDDFQRQHVNDSALVRDRLANDDQPAALRIAHTLKSTAVIIGATPLNQAAARLEQSLFDLGKNTVATDGVVAQKTQTQLTDMERELTRTLQAIKNVLSAFGARDTSISGDQRNFDREKSLALLTRMAPLLHTGNADCLVIMDELAATLTSEQPEWTRFVECMNDLDFSGAAELLPALRNAIASTLETNAHD